MHLSDVDIGAINEALRLWRQGDVCLDLNLGFLHFADLSRPLSPASQKLYGDLDGQISNSIVPILDDGIQGIVLLTQTCDIVRNCTQRPFVEVSPLIQQPKHIIEEVRRLKRPAFAYIPTMACRSLIADLDRTMTVEKAIIATWKRIPGWQTDEEIRAFSEALSRKRSRFAFPDDFVQAARKLQDHLSKHSSRNSEDGIYMRRIQEIRVRAAPSWNHESVHLSWWFIEDNSPDSSNTNSKILLDKWMQLFDKSGRFMCYPPRSCRLEEMTAQDYVESSRLDLDHLSISR